MKRFQNRQVHSLRPVQFERNFSIHAEGSVLVYFGDTLVMCTATIEKGVPFFLRGKKQGWLTAEYSMLPRATKDRNKREVTQGKQSGRTQEIQRLIGRSLRAAVDLYQLGEYTITIDCDVLQADGGTRTAAITGGYVALCDALQKTEKSHIHQIAVAAVSVGIVDDQVLVDLDYSEDVRAMTDMNLVMDSNQHFIEVQGTAEKHNFSRLQLTQMLDGGTQAIAQLFRLQAQSLQIGAKNENQ